MGRYLRVNLFGPGPRLMKKRVYRAAVSQRLRNTGKDTNTEIRYRVLGRHREESNWNYISELWVTFQ